MNLSAFLNPIKEENKKIVVSKRFVENGKPVEWELKAISAEQDDAIRKSCIAKSKKGKEFDEMLYLSKLAAESVVYPDLQNAELQDHYNAVGAEDLLKKMLNFSEYNLLTNELLQMTDMDKPLDDVLGEAKN